MTALLIREGCGESRAGVLAPSRLAYSTIALLLVLAQHRVVLETHLKCRLLSRELHEVGEVSCRLRRHAWLTGAVAADCRNEPDGHKTVVALHFQVHDPGEQRGRLQLGGVGL